MFIFNCKIKINSENRIIFMGNSYFELDHTRSSNQNIFPVTRIISIKLRNCKRYSWFIENYEYKLIWLCDMVKFTLISNWNNNINHIIGTITTPTCKRRMYIIPHSLWQHTFLGHLWPGIYWRLFMSKELYCSKCLVASKDVMSIQIFLMENFGYMMHHKLFYAID